MNKILIFNFVSLPEELMYSGKWVKRTSIFLILFLINRNLLACEPPLPGEESTHPMSINSAIGFWLFVTSIFTTIILVIVDWRKVQRRFYLLGYFIIPFIHPYVWLSVRSGDCGYMMRDASILYTIFIVGLLIFKIIKKRK